ncbi:AAA family ATPase [Stenotrophomonas acidaminiphila]|uniref:AAA family ATPase n=1 Tax=Stenotrophomonas acidaminiphila TaxID=128780 RepID=UPI0015FD6E73|nr:AAA family ATPase [Stenotrophomonas acidaminiphila]
MTEITPHNAFTPAREVQDIDRFAGRAATLDSLAAALQSDGAQIVLYGQRGIGKSSLSRVLAQIAINDEAAISRLATAPHSKFDYLPIYVTCDDSVTNVEKLCLRLLTDEQALAPWIPFKVSERTSSQEGGGKLGVKVIELSGKLSGSITERKTEIQAEVTSTFINACRQIVSSGVAADGVLIVIDEFDRISDKSGIASIIKALGPEKITFALVGVASDVRELISDHESVARQIADGTIFVPPMDGDELAEIISRAMAALNNKYSFELAAITWITTIARGHPFYVHLVGKHALLRAISQRTDVVTEAIAREALADIAFKGSAPIQEAAYKKAVGHSYTREHILKKFASVDADEVYTTNLYGDIARELNIDPSAISVYVGQLASEKYGNVLERSRDRYYQFTDSLFKAYAAARPYERKTGDKDNDI